MLLKMAAGDVITVVCEDYLAVNSLRAMCSQTKTRHKDGEKWPKGVAGFSTTTPEPNGKGYIISVQAMPVE